MGPGLLDLRERDTLGATTLHERVVRRGDPVAVQLRGCAIRPRHAGDPGWRDGLRVGQTPTSHEVSRPAKLTVTVPTSCLGASASPCSSSSGSTFPRRRVSARPPLPLALRSTTTVRLADTPSLGLSLEAMDELFGVTEADAKLPLAASTSVDKHNDGPAVTQVPVARSHRKEEAV